MIKKKILMILTRNPYPVSTGRESILAQTISFLKDDYEITALVFTKDNIDLKVYKKYGINNVKQLSFPSKLEMLKNLLFMKNFSLQERLFYSKKTKNIILQEIKKINPDILYADMIRTAQYIEHININKIVDIDDLLSIRYQRFIKDKESSILGVFNHLLPSFIRNILEKFLKKYILQYEIKLISKREQEVVKNFNCSFLVSEKETKTIKEITNVQTIYTNTQAIILRKNIFTISSENNLLFIGNMYFAQNLSSLKMIVHDILPNITIKYKLFIVGKYDNRTVEIVKENKNIVLLGFVKDLEEILSNIKLAFMPISFGTGIKTKILDCMSYGIPVITNDTGNEGLSTKNMFDIILLNNYLDINNKLENILNNDILLKTISKNGYNYILKHHNHKDLKKQFLNNINVP